jgi:hypothetical protein
MRRRWTTNRAVRIGKNRPHDLAPGAAWPGRGPQSTASASEIRLDLALPRRPLLVVVRPETGGSSWARTECLHR